MEVLEEAFDDDIKTDAKISPWEVTSLYQFQFFCCPQCVFQVNVFQVNRSVLLVQQKNTLAAKMFGLTGHFTK